MASTQPVPSGRAGEPFFATRGVVCNVADLPTADWPALAHAAGLTTIGTHVFPHQVAQFIESEPGQAFLERCGALGLAVEHELHAMSDLLPRELFAEDPTMFRMDKAGDRVGDANFCVHSSDAIEVICENAIRYARVLRPTTGRYFLWIDDGQPMCHCPQCRPYSDSDQALLLENRLLLALREVDANASLAHLAYLNTLSPPTEVRPEPGVFLEFAPITRSWDAPLSERGTPCRDQSRQPGADHGYLLDMLDANLEVFPRHAAQVLEYWLDVSLFSGYRTPAVRLPWRADVCAADVRTYGRRGIRHITTFVAMIDGAYIERFGEPPVDEYGAILLGYSGEP